MKELLKNMVYLGIGAAFLTKEKIVEELKSELNELTEKGKMSQEEGRQFVDDLLRKSDKAKEQLNSWINEQVENRIRQLNLVTRDEIAGLQRAVEDLREAIDRSKND
jgi:polyhydroxyalkanoate synthesis regulator phasin